MLFTSNLKMEKLKKKFLYLDKFETYVADTKIKLRKLQEVQVILGIIGVTCLIGLGILYWHTYF